MTISSNDSDKLRQAGFTDWEILEIANAKTPDGKDQPPINIDGDAWKAVLKSRKEWKDDKIKRGWLDKEIENEIMNYYLKDTRRTPFDFLKAEYRPRKRIDYLTALSESKKMAIEQELKDYGVTVERKSEQGYSPEALRALRNLQKGLYDE
jgi:hypothetical protein